MRPVRVAVIACLGVLLGGVLAGGLITGSPASAAGDHRMASGHPATISVPTSITSGPDRSLWFTSLGSKDNPGSVDQITTGGKLTVYTGRGIDGPIGITVGPDGALWFTNSIGNSVGRITAKGKVTTYTARGDHGPDRDHERPFRGGLVHQCL